MKKFLFLLAATSIFGFLSMTCGGAENICPGCPGYYLNEGRWKAVVISDLHISQGDPEKLERVNHIVNNINKGKYGTVDFVVVTGDAVSTMQNDSGTYNSVLALTTVLNKLTGVTCAIEVPNICNPYYIALGNHDYRFNSLDDSNIQHTLDWINQREWIWWWWTTGWTYVSIWPYTAFDYNGRRFIMLNSYRGNYLSVSRHFDPQELTWFSDLLANAQQLSEVVTIFMHHPLKTDRYSSSWGSQLITSNTDPGFFKLLKQYQDIIKYIFVGHGHRFQEDKLYGKIKVKETASLAEASSAFCTYPKYIIEVDFTSEDIDRDCK